MSWNYVALGAQSNAYGLCETPSIAKKFFRLWKTETIYSPQKPLRADVHPFYVPQAQNL